MWGTLSLRLPYKEELVAEVAVLLRSVAAPAALTARMHGRRMSLGMVSHRAWC